MPEVPPGYTELQPGQKVGEGQTSIAIDGKYYVSPPPEQPQEPTTPTPVIITPTTPPPTEEIEPVPGYTGIPVPLAKEPPVALTPIAKMEYESAYAKQQGLPRPEFTDQQLREYQQARGYMSPEFVGADINKEPEKFTEAVRTLTGIQLQQKPIDLTSVATQLGSKYDVTPDAMLATLQRFKSNPDSPEFRLIGLGGTLTVDQKIDLVLSTNIDSYLKDGIVYNSKTQNIIYDPMKDFSNSLSIIRDISTNSILNIANKTNIPISRIMTPTNYTQSDIVLLIDAGVKPQDLVNAGISSSMVNDAISSTYQKIGDGQYISKSTLESIKKEDSDLYDIAINQGYAQFKKSFNDKYTKIDGGYAKTSDLNDIKNSRPDLYNVLNTQGMDAYIAASKLELEKQDNAKNVLAGYQIPISGAYTEQYPKTPSYDVSRYLREHPNNDSVTILRDLGLKQEDLANAQQYVDTVQSTLLKIDSVSDKLGKVGIGVSPLGIDELVLQKLLIKNDIRPPQGSVIIFDAWKNLDKNTKEKIVTDYVNDPNTRNIFAGITSLITQLRDKLVPDTTWADISLKSTPSIVGKAVIELVAFTPMVTSSILDQSIEYFKKSGMKDEPFIVNSYTTIGRKDGTLPGDIVSSLIIGTAQLFSGAFENISQGNLSKGIGDLTVAVLPFIEPMAAISKGIVTRVRPDTITGSALSLNSDVGRTQLPEGMSPLAARQIIEDVERLQLTGEVPIDRLSVYSSIKQGVPELLSRIEITRDINGILTDITLKTADGTLISHLSGFQQVVNDVLFHNTGDTKAFLDEIKEKGYATVKVAEGQKPSLFVSPQSAQDFMFANPGDSPGTLAIRISPDMWRDLPKDILDNPTMAMIRDKFYELARQGKLKDGFYPVIKSYKPYPEARPTYEYEIMVTPGTKLYPARPEWYAPDVNGAPMTKFTSDISYDGSAGGKVVSFGDSMPMYWLGDKIAIEQGKGVPSIMDMYKAKLLADLQSVRKWTPWNLRIREKGEVTGGISSPNPFVSAFKAIELKAMPEDIGAGRVSGIIYNENGEVLLTRTLGQNHYDLPGGGVMSMENINSAIIREVYEETGLIPTYAEHVDTINSNFIQGKETQPFQIFTIEAKGKPIFGREVAEYVWWDGKSPLNHNVAPFTKQALERNIQRSNLIDNLTVAKIMDDAIVKGKENASKFGGNEELSISNELEKLTMDFDKSMIPYKSLMDNKRLALTSIGGLDNPVYNEPPTSVASIIDAGKAIVSKGIVDLSDVKSIEVPKVVRVREAATTEPQAYRGISGAVEYKPTTTEHKVESSAIIEPSKAIESIKGVEPIKGIEQPTTLEPTKIPEPFKGIETVTIGEPFKGIEPIKTIGTPTIISTTKIYPKTSISDKSIITAPLPATIVWVQGNPMGKSGKPEPMYKILPPPYTEIITTRDKPNGYVNEGFTGEGMVKKTIQVIGGLPPEDIMNLDLGIVRVNILRKGNKPLIEFVQDSDAYKGSKSKDYDDLYIQLKEWAIRHGYNVQDKGTILDYKGMNAEAARALGVSTKLNPKQIDIEADIPIKDKFTTLAHELIERRRISKLDETYKQAHSFANKYESNIAIVKDERLALPEENITDTGKYTYRKKTNYRKTNKPVGKDDYTPRVKLG